jgi:7-cyano-7-deazaguanine synthase in queuosine biosynthesis
MLSGGPDSTAMIWKYLTETGHRVHIHHCILDTNDVIRHQSEWVAVQNIVKWLRNPENGLKYNHGNPIVDRIEGFTYNRFEFKGFGGPADHLLYAMMGACFFIAPGENGAPISWQNHIRCMATGRNVEDCTTSGSSLFHKARLLFETATEGNVQWLTPMINYGKREVINMLPKPLFELTTSCSYPMKINQYWAPCNECIGCARRIEGMYQSDKYTEEELPEWHKYIEKRPNNEVQGYLRG